MKRSKFRLGYTLAFLLLAALIHLFILSWAGALSYLLSLFPQSEAYEPLQVDLWPRVEASSDEEEKTPEEELDEYEPEDEIPEGQVVEAPPSPNRKRPDDPRFLAEQDSRVEQESQSSMRTPGQEAQAASPAVPGQGSDSQTMKGGMRTELEGAGPVPEEIARAIEGRMAAERRAPPSLEDISLEPSLEAMAQAVAGTGLDHLEDVVAGDSTALNTAGWDHASFFNRVKRKVEQFWHPGSEYKKRDPYGNVYGFKDRVTVLLVVLNTDGSLKHLYVMKPSGATFLDDEAYEAIEQAAPFPNVPPGLMDRDDGLVKFTFHFIVEVGSQPVFRMRRYR